VWFQPQKTAAWAKAHQPLCGVIILLVLHVAVTMFAPYFFNGPEPSGESTPLAHSYGLLIDTWIMPVVLLFVLYATGRYMLGSASVKNILWVLVWSQLPIILLTIATIGLQALGLQTWAPVFNNEISFDNGGIVLTPPLLETNAHGFFYFLISTVPLLWSFQILLSGLAAVEGVTVKNAMWILMLAMIALVLIRLPLTVALGDRDLLDVLGLQGIVELK